MSNVLVTMLVLENIFVLGVAILYSLMLHRKEKELKKKEKAIDSISKRVMEEARHRADEILNKAEKEATDIFSQTAKFKNELEKQMSEKIQNSMKMYTDMLKNDFVKAGAMVQTYTRETQITLSEEVEKMYKDMSTSLEGLRKDEYERTKNDLKAYKEKKFIEISEELKKNLVSALKMYLGRSLSAQEHQEIVLKTLEKAKQEGVFI